MDVGSSRSH